MEKTVVEAIFCTTKGSPVCPESILKVKRFDWVVVAPIVTIDLTSAEVVPIPTLSFCAVSLTRVPSSVQPPPEEEGEAQLRLPDPSVCRKVDADWEDGQV